ncbi:acyl-CoA dehydrogenase family protein [Cellulosilyticum ruminicola]|uniref:acyl-CoA dehydrogenase family protein n=1 Tax=Cellulosilyticum ruminicola TaxID=425254 RepID=UPI0006D0AA9D|nr:acyl-CoA dehydrogenase family protein [Cellulosilyticum ruminicola]
MNYFLTEEQQAFKEVVKEFAEKNVKPYVRELDEKQQVPVEIINQMYELGLGSVLIDEAYGGLGGSFMDFAIIVEELSKVCGAIALTIAGSMLGAIPIMKYGNEVQKEKYLKALAIGEKIGAFAISECNAGSDVGSMETTAEIKEDTLVLNGRKCWITNAQIADIYVIIAKVLNARRTQFVAVLVEKGTEGFSFGKIEDKMGMRASKTGELIFDKCEVSLSQVLGKVGDGINIAMETLKLSRPIIGAQALGIAEGAFEDAMKYAKIRKQFGEKIFNFQSIQHMLSDMYMQVEYSRHLVYHTCKLIDEGEKDFILESAMSKIVASDTAMKVTTDAVQIFGGYGCVCEYPMEKRMRDAKITQIYEGTNQILRNVVAKELRRKF